MILSDTDLQILASLLLTRSQNMSDDFHNYIKLLYNTGMRPMEPFQKYRFISHNIDNLVFQPSKRNLVRLLPIETIPDPFINFWFNDSVYYRSVYYRRYLRLFDKLKTYNNITVGTKKLQLYIFRYAYVRRRMDILNDSELLKTEMGWIGEHLVDRYLYRPIIIN